MLTVSLLVMALPLGFLITSGDVGCLRTPADLAVEYGCGDLPLVGLYDGTLMDGPWSWRAQLVLCKCRSAQLQSLDSVTL